MSFQIRTKNGYDFFEVSSSFQKAIRRCDEKEAMFWGIELFMSNYAKYAWKRMIILAHEDIGLGEPGFVVSLMGVKQAYDYLEAEEPKKLNKRLPFIQAVLMCVRARKSRYVDLCHSVYWDYHKKNVRKKLIPDYALDMHTRKGKSMKRGIDHFYDTGAVINNPNLQNREAEFIELARKIDNDTGNNPDAELPKDDTGNQFDPQSKMFDHE